MPPPTAAAVAAERAAQSARAAAKRRAQLGEGTPVRALTPPRKVSPEPVAHRSPTPPSVRAVSVEVPDPQDPLLGVGLLWPPGMRLEAELLLDVEAPQQYSGPPEKAELLSYLDALAVFQNQEATDAMGHPVLYCTTAGTAIALEYQAHAKERLREGKLPYDPEELFGAGKAALDRREFRAPSAHPAAPAGAGAGGGGTGSAGVTGRRARSPSPLRRDPSPSPRRSRSRSPQRRRTRTPAQDPPEVPNTPDQAPSVSEVLVANMMRMRAIRPKNPDAFNGKLDKDGVVGLSARAEAWIYALELGVKNKQYPVTVFVAVSFLKDDALQWWKGAEKLQPDSIWNSTRGWNLFVDLFRGRFILAQDSHFARKELQSLKQTATVVQFISEFDTKLARISTDKKPDQTTLAGYFMEGLHKFIRSKLLGTTRPETYHNYDSLSKAARDMEYMIDSCQHGELAYWQRDTEKSKADKTPVSHKQGGDQHLRRGAEKRGSDQGRDSARDPKRTKGDDRRDDSRKARSPGPKDRTYDRVRNDDRHAGRTQARLEKFPHQDSDYPRSGDRGFERGPCGYCKHDGHSINQCLALQEKKFAKGEITTKTLTPFRKA